MKNKLIGTAFWLFICSAMVGGHYYEYPDMVSAAAGLVWFMVVMLVLAMATSESRHELASKQIAPWTRFISVPVIWLCIAITGHPILSVFYAISSLFFAAAHVEYKKSKDKEASNA